MSDSSRTDFGSRQQPLSPSIHLDEARRELRDDILRGHGGRAALARFSDRLDTIVRQVFAAAPKTSQSIVVIAIGWLGERALNVRIFS